MARISPPSGSRSPISTSCRATAAGSPPPTARVPRLHRRHRGDVTGHCHPQVVEAIRSRPARFIHAQVNCYRHDLLEQLAERLAEVTPGRHRHLLLRQLRGRGDRGRGEAGQAGDRSPERRSCSRGASTAARHLTMAMTTSKTGYRAGHAPLPSGVFVAPFPHWWHRRVRGRGGRPVPRRLAPPAGVADGAGRDRGDDPRAGARRGRVPAGAGGVPPGAARDLREHGILFVADEVQSGLRSHRHDVRDRTLGRRSPTSS